MHSLLQVRPDWRLCSLGRCKLEGIWHYFHWLTIVITNFMQQNPGLILQQDNARPHSARLTANFLHQNNVDVLPWPSMSPDMNPIEHVWSYLKRKLHDNNLRNVVQLRNFITREWAALPQRFLQNLVASMRRRCVALVNANGGHTRY